MKIYQELFKKSNKNPEDIFDDFFGLYEQEFFSQKDINNGLTLFESPFKEIIAAHQAWGMIGSDGFECYLEQVDKQFDLQVEKGLALLGFNSCYSALSEARDIHGKNSEIPENDDDRLWDLFYEPIREFDSIAGLYLQNKYKET